MSADLPKENRSSSRKGWWVSLYCVVTDCFGNLMKFMEPLSRKTHMTNIHKPNILHETFSQKPTPGLLAEKVPFKRSAYTLFHHPDAPHLQPGRVFCFCRVFALEGCRAILTAFGNTCFIDTICHFHFFPIFEKRIHMLNLTRLF